MKVRLQFKMNSAQRKAMNEEINRQILENDAKYSMDFDSTVLYVLHRTFGFGKKRLRRFWDAFLKEHKALREYYQMDPEDDGWLCRRLLKEKSVDIEEWYKEREKEQ